MPLATIRIVRRFTFEMSHVLQHHQGLCKNIHGHSYILEICVKGPVNNQNSHSESGMLMDFKRLKILVHENIIDVLDHALLVPKSIPYRKSLETIKDIKIFWFENEPTCENLVIWMANKLTPYFKNEIKLHWIRLAETASSFAEWHSEDQSIT